MNKILAKMVMPSVNEAWDKLIKLRPALKTHYMPSVLFDMRLTKAAAYCYYQMNVIRLSPFYYTQNQKEFEQVIIPHELIHQAIYNLHGETESDHCPLWEQLMIEYGLEPNHNTSHTMTIFTL